MVIAGELPHLSLLAVDVSGGEIDSDQLKDNFAAAKSLEPGPKIETFTILADPAQVVNDIPVKLNLSADRVTFGYGRNKSGKLVASLIDAAKGRLSVQLSHADLELALLELAKEYSASTGVVIQKVDVALTPNSACENRCIAGDHSQEIRHGRHSHRRAV